MERGTLTQVLEHGTWLWRQGTRATMETIRRRETKGKHQTATDTGGGRETAKIQYGAHIVVGFIGLGSNPVWSASFRNCESLATRGRFGSLGPSQPYQALCSTSFPALASSSGSISKFRNRRGQGRRRNTRGRCKAIDLESLPEVLSSSHSPGWEISGPGRQGVERAQNLRKHQRHPSSIERSWCAPCPCR